MFWECAHRDGRAPSDVVTWGSLVDTTDQLEQLQRDGFHERLCADAAEAGAAPEPFAVDLAAELWSVTGVLMRKRDPDRGCFYYTFV